MTSLYHAFARLKNEKNVRVLGLDLNERELKRSVVKPYKTGKDLYLQSTVTRLDDVESLTIIRTPDASTVELKRLADEHQAKVERERQESGLIILGTGRGHSPTELLESGEDVTGAYISSAPGSGTPTTKVYAFLHNQWVIGVGLLIAGIVIGKLWGKGS